MIKLIITLSDNQRNKKKNQIRMQLFLSGTMFVENVYSILTTI